MPSYTLLDLTAQVRAIGRAAVFYGTGAFAGSGNNLALTHLMDTEGDIQIAANEAYNELTLPELTGPAKHERYVSGEDPVVTLPGYAADASLRDILSPLGSASGGHFRQRPVTEYSLVLIPEQVFIESNAQVALGYTAAGGWTVGGDAASAAQLALLDLSIWFWRGHFTRALPQYRHAEGGKVIESISYQAMFNGDMPDGHRLYTVGRPDQSGIEIAAA